jgi:uncharacterized tellurite resistance protein B-like protein
MSPMDFLKIFGLGKQRGASDRDLGGLFAALENMLAGKPVDEIKLVAGWAGLLGRVANADMELSDEEIARIREILEKNHGLGGTLVSEVTDLLAGNRVELLSVEDHFYARMINDVAGREEKLALIESLFQVAAADDIVRQNEDATIRMISRSLFLSHDEFIEVRRKFRDKLAVLKNS